MLRNIMILLLAMLAPLAYAATSTPFTGVAAGPAVNLPANTPAIIGNYSITGSFVATLQWQTSPDGANNWRTLQTYTGTQAATVFAVPGWYRWNCSAYTSGTATGVIAIGVTIYQQQYNQAGTLVFQVDSTGVTSNNFIGPIGGTVTVANGGTGNTSATAFALIAGGTTSTAALQSISGTGTSGQVLTSNGAAALPTWQSAGGGSIGGSIAAAQVAFGSGTNAINGSPGLVFSYSAGAFLTVEDPSNPSTVTISSTDTYDGLIYFASGGNNGFGISYAGHADQLSFTSQALTIITIDGANGLLIFNNYPVYLNTAMNALAITSSGIATLDTNANGSSFGGALTVGGALTIGATLTIGGTLTEPGVAVPLITTTGMPNNYMSLVFGGITNVPPTASGAPSAPIWASVVLNGAYYAVPLFGPLAAAP